MPVTLTDGAALAAGFASAPSGASQIGLSSRYLRVPRHPQFAGGGAGDVLISSLNGMYMWRPWLAARAAVPLVTMWPDGGVGAETGFGDPVLGLYGRHRFADTPYLLGWALDSTLPLGNEQDGMGAPSALSRASSFVGCRLASRGLITAGVGMGWTYAVEPGAVADAGIGGSWTLNDLFTVRLDVRAQIAISEPTTTAFSLADQPRQTGDAMVLIMPGLLARVTDTLSLAAMPIIPLGDRSFTYGGTLAVSYDL